jgi:hypothetical protein
MYYDFGNKATLAANIKLKQFINIGFTRNVAIRWDIFALGFGSPGRMANYTICCRSVKMQAASLYINIDSYL